MLTSRKNCTWGRIACIGSSLDIVHVDLNCFFNYSTIDGVLECNWDMYGEDNYTVCSFRRLFDGLLLDQTPVKTVWDNSVPSTRSNLVRRGVPCSLVLCPCCHIVAETEDHIFNSCSTAGEVRAKLHNLCFLIPVTMNSLVEWTDCTVGMSLNGKVGTALKTVMKAYIWVIWRHRNQAVFHSKLIVVNSIVSDIKSFTFTWIKCRTKLGPRLLWENCCINPMLDLL